ncbi:MULTISPECIES: MarR family winged helix-turn-helix transcriptional regulator [Cupriavidus]|uniref:MarR family winged helix-turn-helix transcriptional regulator n=1 Tax=Cupriavidus TaxID=106589 RepID=UPI000451B863|nr:MULTISPECIES: MarR family transcriptional regulator [Cupriavidus]KDP84000.1 MarR family transcriptional regulator [Cupriavidus sp. SK-3]MDF3886817.1 MarR family transcriptional regulator [Cupriavidus basilensis]
MPSSDHPILEYLSFRLDRLSELSKAAGSQFYENEFGVTVRDLRVLRLVALEPGLTLSRLIELSLLEKTQVSKLVSALVRQGLLSRQIGELDARQINLFLSTEGESMVKRTYERGNTLEKALLATLTEAELKTFNRCIDKLTDTLEHRARDAGHEGAARVKPKRAA